MSKLMLIEGIPGSGKSSIAGVSALQRRNHHVYQRLDCT
jgi:thymidylate kinase